VGEVQGWEVRARCCSCSKVATGRKERDRERGRGGREGERGKREREESEFSSSLVQYGYVYFCLDLCVANLGRPWPTSSHPLTLRNLPVCAWIGGWIHNAQSVGNTPTTLRFVHTPTIHGKAAAIPKFALQCPTPLFGKTTTITPVCSASICKLSSFLSTFVPFFPTLLPYSLIRNHQSIYLLALMATHGLFSTLSLLPCLLTVIIFLFHLRSFLLRSFPSFVFIGNGGWKNSRPCGVFSLAVLLFFPFFFTFST